MSHEGYLRHLLVRKASRTGEILVALVTTSQDPWQGETAVEGSLDVDALITGFKDLLLSLEQDRKLAGKFAGILHITNDSIADVVQSDRTELVGRTDSNGSKEYNDDLAIRRVKKVADYAVAHGVDLSHLVGMYKGEEAPVDTNDTEAGRANNRRVDIFEHK